eukprot:2944478-Amphidinium_carterae.1
MASAPAIGKITVSLHTKLNNKTSSIDSRTPTKRHIQRLCQFVPVLTNVYEIYVLARKALNHGTVFAILLDDDLIKHAGDQG